MHDLQGSLEAFEKSVANYEEVLRTDAQNTALLRDIAQSCKNLGQIHTDLSQAAAGQIRQAHLEAAKQNYQRALDILLQLKSQNAFAAVDQKLFEDIEAAIRKYK